MAESAEEFLSQTAALPAVIGDTLEAPPAIDGLPPSIDPMKPWKAIEVSAYVPVAEWLIQKGSRVLAAKQDEPIWEVDDEEIAGIRVPLTEATQKCLYDLRLSRVAGNPYVALLAAVATLGGVKYAAIQVMKALEKARQEERAQAVAEGRDPGPDRPTIVRTSDTAARKAMDRQSQNGTRPASSRTSGRTRGSEAASSHAGSPAQGNRSSSSTEFDPDDEL